MKEHLVLSEAVSRATQPASRRAVPCTSVNSRDLSRQARRLQEHPEPPVGVASLLPRGGPPISQILILQWILHGQVIAQPTCRREWPTVSCGSPSRSRTQHRGGGRGRRDACAGRPARASSREAAPPTPRPSLPRARALRRVPARRLSERRAQRVPRRVPGTPGPALLAGHAGVPAAAEPVPPVFQAAPRLCPVYARSPRVVRGELREKGLAPGSPPASTSSRRPLLKGPRAP